jgi:hypothetical protein
MTVGGEDGISLRHGSILCWPEACLVKVVVKARRAGDDALRRT